MKVIKAAACISVFGVYVLASNWEIGNIGSWGCWTAFGITLLWTGLLLWASKKNARRCNSTKRTKQMKDMYIMNE